VDNYDLPTPEAWRRLQENRGARWASGLDSDPAEGTAWQRITGGPMFEPVLTPEFEITPHDRIFALGSCFARHVEGALKSLGFAVESLTTDFDDIPSRYPMATPITFMNKYNTEAIYGELQWALDPGVDFPPEALVPLDNGDWSDPHTSPVFGNASLDVSLQRHLLLTNVVRRVVGCRIVVITLGLVETFFDTVTGLYTNSTPRLDAQRERFRFRVLSYEEVVDGLERVHALLSERGHPELQIVVTVSPVPLDATFTGQDVVLANTFSKALLRTAAGHWAARHSNVHYFPSYEIVVNSSRENVWERDGRHVRFDLVHHVMKLFADAYVARDTPVPAAVD
jgi:GSCFA family